MEYFHMARRGRGNKLSKQKVEEICRLLSERWPDGTHGNEWVYTVNEVAILADVGITAVMRASRLYLNQHFASKDKAKRRRYKEKLNVKKTEKAVG